MALRQSQCNRTTETRPADNPRTTGAAQTHNGVLAHIHRSVAWCGAGRAERVAGVESPGV